MDEAKLDELLELMREVRDLLAKPPEPVYKVVFTARGLQIVRDDGQPTLAQLAARHYTYVN